LNKLNEEVGSNNTTEESSNIPEIRPEDSISNSGKIIQEESTKKIYNIEGQLKTLNGKVIE
jgi:hypothetical protein